MAFDAEIRLPHGASLTTAPAAMLKKSFPWRKRVVSLVNPRATGYFTNQK